MKNDKLSTVGYSFIATSIFLIILLILFILLINHYENINKSTNHFHKLVNSIKIGNNTVSVQEIKSFYTNSIFCFILFVYVAYSGYSYIKRSNYYVCMSGSIIFIFMGLFPEWPFQFLLSNKSLTIHLICLSIGIWSLIVLNNPIHKNLFRNIRNG